MPSLPAPDLVQMWVLPFPDAKASSWNLRDLDQGWPWADPGPPGPQFLPWWDLVSQKGLLVLTWGGGEYRVLRTTGRQPCLQPHAPGVRQACSCLRAFAHAVSPAWKALPSDVCITSSCCSFKSLLRCPPPGETLSDFLTFLPFLHLGSVCTLSCFIFSVTLTTI